MRLVRQLGESEVRRARGQSDESGPEGPARQDAVDAWGNELIFGSEGGHRWVVSPGRDGRVDDDTAAFLSYRVAGGGAPFMTDGWSADLIFFDNAIVKFPAGTSYSGVCYVPGVTDVSPVLDP